MADTLEDTVRAVIARTLPMEGAALPILHAVQEEFGYLPEAALPIIAEALNITRAEVYGIATFYHDFRLEPRGRHLLQLCRAEACQSMGAVRLAGHAKQRLGVDWGGTAADGSVTLGETYCLGLCACAPAAMIDGRPVARLNERKLDAILAEAAR